MSSNPGQTLLADQHIPLEDDHSTPLARAKRLIRVRHLANLSREAMCANGELNMFTIRGWELAKHGGLPPKGALKIIDRVAKEGVFCTVDWLLHEEGEPPRVVIEKRDIILDEIQQSLSDLTYNQMIDRELAYFYHIHDHATHYKIKDNTMFPTFEVGDVVAGLKLYEEKIESLMGKNCIVQLSDGSILFRKLHSITSNGLCSLVARNTAIDIDELIKKDVEVIYAAPVIWHRKGNP